MICALEIAMLVWGIFVMVTGKLKVSKTKEVRGWAARGLAVLLLIPIPLAMVIIVIYGAICAGSGRQIDPLVATGLEVATVLGCAVVTAVAGMIIGKEPAPAPGGFPVQTPPQGPA